MTRPHVLLGGFLNADLALGEFGILYLQGVMNISLTDTQRSAFVGVPPEEAESAARAEASLERHSHWLTPSIPAHPPVRQRRGNQNIGGFGVRGHDSAFLLSGRDPMFVTKEF
jgi:hypothetical protein